MWPSLVSVRVTYRARDRLPEAHAELVTEDVQEEAFTSLQREEDGRLAASHQSRRGLNWFGGCTDPLVLRT